MKANVTAEIALNEIEPLSTEALSKPRERDKSFMDHKLENSGVLVRIFDMIFDEKVE